MNLYYAEDGVYMVEKNDQVEVRINGGTHEGIVTRLFPCFNEVQVRYHDQFDLTVSATPRQKSARVPVAAVDLIARDG